MQSETSRKEWGKFLEAAAVSGIFPGGSEMGNRIQFGEKSVDDIPSRLGGFLRFEAEPGNRKDIAKKHPVRINGGTLELYELPKS